MFTFVTVRDRKVNTSDTVNEGTVTATPADAITDNTVKVASPNAQSSTCAFYFFIIRGGGDEFQNTVTITKSRSQGIVKSVSESRNRVKNRNRK